MKGNIIYHIINNKGILSALFASLAFVFGIIGYVNSFEIKEFLNATVSTFSLFGLNFPPKDELNVWIFLASVFAMATVFLSAILFIFKDAINKKIFTARSKEEHTAVFGLGQISKTFLEDCSMNDNVIIVEKDDLYADEYRTKGFGVKTGDAFDRNFLDKHLNLEKMEYALIALGDDRRNIEFAKKIITQYKK